jgi:copper transport protein
MVRVWAVRTWIGLATALVALAIVPGARAHAVLQQVTPGNDSVVETAPEQVVLRFSEPIETALGAVRVLNESGEPVSTGSLIRPDERSVGVRLDEDLPNGTYTVAWRVTSADQHPVFGASVFHVGAPGARPAGVTEQVLAESEPPKEITVAFTAVRFLSFALIILCGGGTAALALVLGSASESVRNRLLTVLAGLAVGLGLVSLAGIVLQGADAVGVGFKDATRWSVVEEVLDTRFGQVWLARAGLAVALAGIALAVRRRPTREWMLDAALLVCVGLILSPAAAGHAAASGALSFVMDVVHVQAAAIWIGGLAFLFLALVWTRDERWELAANAVPRFSTIALVSVGALVCAGIVNAYLQIRTWSGLVDTTYGRLVLTKAALILLILALAAYNNRRSVPRLKARIASTTEQRRFLRTVLAELGIVIAVLAVTAVLVAEPPARAVVTPSGPVSETTALGDLELRITVDPAIAGSNDVNLYIVSGSGQPVDLADVRLAASLPDAGIGPVRHEARRVAPGRYTATAVPFSIPGDWELRVEARRGEFEALTGKVSVPIRKEP